MSDAARKFTFGELWSLAMDDPDFAAGRIDAHEAVNRITGRDTPRPTEMELAEFIFEQYGEAGLREAGFVLLEKPEVKS